MVGIDGAIDQFILSHPPGTFLQKLGETLRDFGKGDHLALLCVFLIAAGYFLGNRALLRNAWGGILTLIFSGVAVQTIKHLIGRARPKMNLGEFHFIGPNFFKGGFDSFPSGHSMAAFALAALFSQSYPRGRPFFYGTACLIALVGRVGLRHHFFTDVLAGALLGYAIGIFIYRKLNKDSSSPMEIIPEPKIQNQQVKSFHWALLIIFSGLVLLVGLSSNALWDRDETEYAQSVIEMNQHKEWLIPTLEGKPFLEKPILLFWGAKLSVLTLGVSEFAFRFPSALLGILTCLLTFFIGKTLYNSRVGVISGFIVSSSFLFIGCFRLLLTDAYLVFFTHLSLLFYLYSEKKPDKKWVFMTLSYFSIGMALLSKGPIALFPIPIYLLYEWFIKEEKNFLPHLLCPFVAIAAALPWFSYSWMTQKDAAENFMWHENALRFLKGSEGHAHSPLYYLPVFLFGFLPWSIYLGVALYDEWLQRKKSGKKINPAAFLLLAWPASLFLFFSVAAHKLPHYLLPMLPCLACFLGNYWVEWSDSNQKKLPAAWTTATLAFLLLCVPLSLYFVKPNYASFHLVLPFFLFFLAAKLSIYFMKMGNLNRSFFSLVGGSLGCAVTLSLTALPKIDAYRVMKPMGLAIQQFVPKDARLLGYQISEPSLFIYGERLFPKVEQEPLETLLQNQAPTYLLVTESTLKQSAVRSPYTILAQKTGFAENEGETTLLLLKNNR